MAIVNHDQLLKERQKLLPEDREFHYVMSEMVEPLTGGVILGGYVDENEYGAPFPVLRVMIKGKVYEVIVSQDDERNGGGRLFIEPEPIRSLAGNR